MQDAPSPAALIEAAARFLRETAAPALTGQTAFHARVAAGALEIAARELRLTDPEGESASLRALLGEEGDPPTLNRRLAERIAAGELTLRTPGLADHLWRVTLDKLAVDQPRYAAPPTRTDP